METGGLSLRRQVAFSLLSADVDQNCLIDALSVLYGLDDTLDVVPVDRSEVSDPHLLKVHSRNHQRFERLLRAADSLYYTGNRVIERVVDPVP